MPVAGHDPNLYTELINMFSPKLHFPHKAADSFCWALPNQAAVAIASERRIEGYSGDSPALARAYSFRRAGEIMGKGGREVGGGGGRERERAIQEGESARYRALTQRRRIKSYAN